MRVAVNARHMLDRRLEGVGVVSDEVMKRIVHSHPEDQFDYYFDRPYDPRFVHGANVHPHAFAPVTRLPILVRWWLNQPVRRHMMREGADVFFSPDGFVPMKLKIPKVSMVHDVAFLRYPEHLQHRIRNFYERWMPRFLAETDHIITVSEFSKKELIEGYHVSSEKISVVYNGTTTSYVPIDPSTQKIVRDQYSGGHPYFLFLGAIHPRKNVPTLVKAFEKFKAERPSEYQLIIAGRPSWHTTEVMNLIRNSPVKESIHLPGYVPTHKANALVGAASAMIYPSLYEGFGLPMVEAMACGVPVICSNASCLPEIAGDAALKFEPLNVEELTQLMSVIISDSSIKDQLIQKGLVRSKFFSWDKAAAEIYSILENVI